MKQAWKILDKHYQLLGNVARKPYRKNCSTHNCLTHTEHIHTRDEEHVFLLWTKQAELNSQWHTTSQCLQQQLKHSLPLTLCFLLQLRLSLQMQSDHITQLITHSHCSASIVQAVTRDYEKGGDLTIWSCNSAFDAYEPQTSAPAMALWCHTSTLLFTFGNLQN